jgi:hypothetical protein
MFLAVMKLWSGVLIGEFLFGKSRLIRLDHLDNRC